MWKEIGENLREAVGEDMYSSFFVNPIHVQFHGGF